jgi:preprotein translocase subunit YajC
MVSFAALAQAASTGSSFDLLSLAPLVLIFVVFYFLLIRPQQKKMKQHREMVMALKRGDRVVTGGGIVGLVTKVVSDTEVEVEIAPDVRVNVMRASVSDMVSKSATAESDAKSK